MKHQRWASSTALQVAIAALGLNGAFSVARAETPLPLKLCMIDDRSGAAADNGIRAIASNMTNATAG